MRAKSFEYLFVLCTRAMNSFSGAYAILDVMPNGFETENGPFHSLADWVRPKNMYAKDGTVEANGLFHAPACACSAHK